MNPYSPISWLYVHGFLGKNWKDWILRLLLDIWKSGSVCRQGSRPINQKCQMTVITRVC